MAKAGDPQAGFLERRFAIPRGGLLQRCGGHDVAWVGHRRRQRQRHRFDRLRDRFRQHAPHLHLLPAVPVKRFLILASLASAPLAGLRAQGSAVLYGSVHDTLGQPLRAYVRLLEGGRAALADGRGRYRLAVPAGTVVARIALIGFEAVTDTLTLAAGDSLQRDYRLNPAVVQLPPTIVTAAKRSQFLDQAVTSVAIVSDSDVARHAVTTIDEAVNKAPGVQFLNGQVNIRGSSGYVQGLGSRVLLLVDGVPANQGDRGGITRDIQPGFHARVRALGGAYANPPAEIWSFRDYTGAQEGLDVTGSYGTDRARGTFTGGGWHSDGHGEHDRRNHWQTGGKAQRLATPDTRVTASGSWVSDQYETPLVWCTRGTCDDRGQAFQPFMIDASGRGSLTRSDKGYVAGTVEHHASEGLGWHARASWGRTHFTDFQPGRDDWGVANRFGAEFRGELHPTGNRVATVGTEASFSDVRTNIFTGDTNLTSNAIRTHDQREFAAYAEGEQRLGRARLTAGVRTDFIVVDGGVLSTVVSPRIGAVLPTVRTGVWRASVGRGFRAPSLAERFVSTTVQAFRVVPNPDLHSETAWSVELGNAATISPAVRSDAALFWTEAHDLIEPAVDTSGARIQFRNVARARLAGLDLALTTTPFTRGLTATLSYTLLYARELAHDGLPERPLAFRPRHLVTLGADYQRGAVSVGGDFRYTSRFERVELYETDPRVAEKVLNLRTSV